MSISEEYAIIEALGAQRKRKFGSTYLVEHKITGDRAVLKAVRKDAGQDMIAERLRQEAQFHFDFPGLPTVLDFYESDSEVLCVKAYQNGVPIDQFWKNVKRRERLPFLIDFIRKLTPIFEHLKAQGVVHCDIKPSNLIIEGNVTEFNVHLIDFGLAINTQQIEHRAILFPLGYAAPELLLNHLDIVDQRSDIFALGIVIWRLYTGTLPLAHPNPSIYTNLQLTHPLPEHSDLPKKVYRIIERISSKHQFKLPPNRMEALEVKAHLSHAMDLRPAALEEVSDLLEKIRIPFYQRRSLR